MRTKSVPLKYKIIAYFAAWLVALFATNPNGKFWPFVWMFPLGLAAFINRRWGNDGGWGVFAACIAVYLVHGYFYFRSRSLRATLFLLVALIALLICNVPGCRAMLNTHQNREILTLFDDADNVIETHEHAGDFKEYSQPIYGREARSIIKCERW